MILLTAGGAFASAFGKQCEASVASQRTLTGDAFNAALASATTVIHNAASLNCESEDEYLRRNFDFTRELVTKLQAHNPRAHLLLLSSMSVLDPRSASLYGDVAAMTPYAYSKYLAETYCLRCALPRVSCVRFSTLFYRDHRRDGLSALIRNAVVDNRVTIFNGGEARRDFIPLEIAAGYVAQIAQTTGTARRVSTVASGQSTSFAEVVRILRTLIPALEVEDQSVPRGDPVLADFSRDGIADLDEIPFAISEVIASYVRELRACA